MYKFKWKYRLTTKFLIKLSKIYRRKLEYFSPKNEVYGMWDFSNDESEIEIDKERERERVDLW